MYALGMSDGHCWHCWGDERLRRQGRLAEEERAKGTKVQGPEMLEIAQKGNQGLAGEGGETGNAEGKCGGRAEAVDARGR